MARHLHIFVLIDALGWEIIKGREFLNDLLPYRKPLRTVLGYSSGAIPSILTGKTPAEHGQWNLVYYDPEGSPFRRFKLLALLPDKMLNNRVARKLIKEFGRRVLKLGHCFECCVNPKLLPWFNWVEKRNIYAPDGIEGCPSIFDELAKARVPHRIYSYHHLRDGEIFAQALRDLQSREAIFYFVYLSELDGFLHNHRQEKGFVDEKLAWYGTRLRDLFTSAREIDPELEFTILSDHGMTPVHHHFDLVREIKTLRFSTPNDYLAVYDSTMARFWFFNDTARREIIDRLRTVQCGRILPDGELKQMGIFFSDQRYGELVFLLQPGWLISESGFNGSSWMPSGMHGYHPDDINSDGIFLTNRKSPGTIETIADVFACMRRAACLDDTYQAALG